MFLRYRLFCLTLAILAFVLFVPVQAQQVDPMLQFQLSSQLQKSASRWNRGDLDGFLQDYLQSEEMTFTSGGRILRGFEALNQRYKKSYGDSAQTMGQLSFSDLEGWRLGPDQALVLGRWRLERDEVGATQTDEGVFTLVMVQINGEWKILHDHTSASK